MSAESPRHARSGGPLTVPSQPPPDRSIIDAVSGFINDVKLTSSSTVDPKDVIQWARFETADINEPTPEGDGDNDVPPLLLVLGYGAGVQVWLIPPNGEAQEVLSWRQGTVRVLRILPTPVKGDCFAPKRPLIALCDSASPGPAFCSLSFISIRGGEQVKSIKFKNPILDVLANKRSVVVSFSERFAVFDAGTLEDRMAVTTCYPCPCPLGGAAPINPLALGDRWLAYADKKLNQSKRSSGGCEGEGVSSYTATVLHAAKSLGKGLRGLGESVAHSLAGTRQQHSPSPPQARPEHATPGIVTVLDIEGLDEEDGQDVDEPYEPMVAHFVAHSEPVIALKFDPSGMLLITADRRGHDFHVFRINPHPCGPGLASVHHLYILHRGDTTAKVQDISISPDSRWAAVSTLRGTTHVFAVSAYGGACGVRTHSQPRVVNRLSRFHRSAGLPLPHDATHAQPTGDASGSWYPNPRLPPYPAPVVNTPLAQLRPTPNLATHTVTRTSSGRQRLSSLSEDSSGAPLLARAQWGLYSGGAGAAGAAGAGAGVGRGPPHAALYLLEAGGTLAHLVLHPRPAANVPKEKICDESPIELCVEAVGQWPLARSASASDLLAPLPPASPLLQPLSCRRCADMCMSEEERWLSQVEIVTHAGPHRRLWMGPQFVFKTYNCTGSSSSLSEAETVEVEAGGGRVARSNPVNMPAAVPVLVDSGSASSLEHSPSDSFRRKSLLAESGRAASVCDVQLREDLAEAMKEDHGSSRAESGTAARLEGVGRRGPELTVDPQGTVVEAPRWAPPPPVGDADADRYTHDNADESRFRPVVRACAAPPASLPARALPAGTTIPAQPLPRRAPPAPPAAPRDLASAVRIPAARAPLPPPAPPPAWRPTADVFAVVPARPPPSSTEVPPRRDSPEPITPSRDSDSKTRRREKTDSKSKREPADPKVEPKKEAAEPKEAPGVDKKIAPRNEPTTEALALSRKEKAESKITPKKESRGTKVPSGKETSEKNDFAETISLPRREPSRHKSIPKEDSSDLEPIKSTQITSSMRKSVDREKSVPRETAPGNILSPTEFSEIDLPKPSYSSESSSRSESADRDVPNKQSLLKTWKKDPIEPAWALTIDKIDTKDRVSPSKDSSEKVPVRYPRQEEIKTEEQAWDMLLCEPEKTKTDISPTASDDKPKTKRNRKIKKIQDDPQNKSEDDSFVEIHAIEENAEMQQTSGELVSISMPYDEVSTSYSSKMKKSRSPKNTADKKEEQETKLDEWTIEDVESTVNTKSSKKKSDATDNLIPPEADSKTKSKETKCDKTETIDVTNAENVVKETSADKKNKCINEAWKSVDKILESDVKDVYVIDSSKEEFPEIQITRGSKVRKKSPHVDKITEDKEVTEKPAVKSWSSIAASKNTKKDDKRENVEEQNIKLTDECESSTSVSLQEELIRLCKRTDIMVAECDAPTELNFIDEHHSLIQDLPPLEIDFGLDDFRLEVMRDCLLEPEPKITSPICKINIDSILSSIKESTSAFNLIDLEKVPDKKEKGFSIIQSDKITSQEVKVDDDKPEDKEMMEKSSDDDNTSPALSADSDKEDKKSTGASNITMPSPKQSSKSKKSRRKKK